MFYDRQQDALCCHILHCINNVKTLFRLHSLLHLQLILNRNTDLFGYLFKFCLRFSILLHRIKREEQKYEMDFCSTHSENIIFRLKWIVFNLQLHIFNATFFSINLSAFRNQKSGQTTTTMAIIAWDSFAIVSQCENETRQVLCSLTIFFLFHFIVIY